MSLTFAGFRNIASAAMVIGGAFFFATIGFLTVGGLAITSVSKQTSSSGGYDGFGQAIGVLMAAGAGLLLGFAVGLLIMLWLARHSKLVSLGAVMALLGYAGAGTGLLYIIRIQRGAVESTAKIRAAADARKQMLARLDAENMRQAKIRLPSLLQDLFYPGAEIIDGGYSPDFGRVILSVHASIDTVCDYYRARLSDATFERGELRGKTRRPGDGRTVDVMVNHSSGRVSVSIVLDTSDAQERTNAASAAAQVKPNSPPEESAPSATNTKAQNSVFDNDPSWVLASSVEELTTAYGNLVYPGSHTNYPSTTHPRPDVPGSAVALATTESFETVVAYYRPLVTIQLDDSSKFVGTATRADGRSAFIDVSRKSDLTFVGLSAR